MILYILVVLSVIVGAFTVPEVFIGSCIFLIISFISQGMFAYGHQEDMNQIWEYRQDMKIQKRKSTELLSEFTLYLANMYPDIEKEIIKSMKPDNVSAYMIKYPELKSSETICKLVDLINGMKSKIYNYESNITGKVKNIKDRVYAAGIWVIATSKMKSDMIELHNSYENLEEK